MATVDLHIGAPKTATSTLQRVLAANAETLSTAAVLYPQSILTGDAHHVLACDLIDHYQGTPMADYWYGDQPRGSAWQRLRAEIEQQPRPVEHVLLSSELFFGQSRQLEQIIQAVAAHLREHRVRIVVYLRRQDQWYSSFFNQDVKGVRQWSHGAYHFYETHQVFEYDYHSLLQRWSEVFGRENILLRPYEPEQWYRGDIVRDFCHVTGIPGLDDSDRLDSNRSLGFHQLYIKQCLNRVGFRPEWNDEVLQLVTELIPEEPAADSLFVNQRLYQRYRDQWRAVNRKLAADFLGGVELFREPLPEQAPGEIFPVNKLVVAAYVNDMTALLNSPSRVQFRPLFARAAAIALSEKNLWESLSPAVKRQLLSWL